MTKFIAMVVVNLVTPKVGTKRELLFNKSAKGSPHQKYLINFPVSCWCDLHHRDKINRPLWLPKVSTVCFQCLPSLSVLETEMSILQTNKF